MSEYSDELRTKLAEFCAETLDIDCDADVISVGSDFADVVVRVAFWFPLDAWVSAKHLSNWECEIDGIPVNAQIKSSGKYINITLNDEYLAHLANKIITNYPMPECLGASRYDYAVARAVMLSRKDDDFMRIIRDERLRRAFIELIKCDDRTKQIAAERFLAAQEHLTGYEGMGKYAECAAKILNKYRKGNEP